MSETTAIATIEFTPQRIDLVKRLLCPDLTNDEMAVFIGLCKRTGLDPFAKQIYAIRRKGKMTIQTGIDGYRLIADRTEKYAGSDDAFFDDEMSPNKATVTVYKIVGGQRCAFTASARWAEYYPGDASGQMWNKMPCTMLAKCAEALALRKAFPAELSGVYTGEEMEQAGEEDHPRHAPPQQQPPQQQKPASPPPPPAKPQTPKLTPEEMDTVVGLYLDGMASLTAKRDRPGLDQLAIEAGADANVKGCDKAHIEKLKAGFAEARETIDRALAFAAEDAKREADEVARDRAAGEPVADAEYQPAAGY